MLSILIPARNEQHLQRTVDSIAASARGEYEILVALDNCTIEQDITIPNGEALVTSCGQRGATNLLAEGAQYPYLMKTDGHCLFAPGFDLKILKDMDNRTIMSPYMLVLDEETWTPRNDKRTSQYCFNQEMVMLYDTEKPEILSESMCLQGSCFVVAKDTYFAWKLGDETMGSWGGQGAELGIKAYLNGGRCMTTKETYYAHLFRTTDEAFPYDRGQDPGKHANDELIRRYKNKSIAGLIEKFKYPADWTKETVHNLS